MARAFIYYWLPGDNDQADHPNAFEVQTSGAGVKLRDIRARFPIAGNYHFRFKMKWESGHVWMDVTNEESVVPTFEDKVFAKVLRVSWGTEVQQQQPSPASTTKAQASPMSSSPISSQGDLLFESQDTASPAPGKPSKNDDFDMLFG
mmetsp:Transcript_91753/g.163300  ORF Transcript_91753/g.163300 Transcript_91753/m.163300 type:complete len:147 (-) Transcript_91753:112-552(-)